MVLLSLPFEAHATAAGMIGQRIWDKRRVLKAALEGQSQFVLESHELRRRPLRGPPAIAPAALRLS
jgi:hypothetical protein